MDVFATLGIAPAFDVDLAAVEKVHRELSRALHPDKYIGASPSERRAALTKAVEVNEEGAPKADPEFLMDMLEQREALSDAKAAKDLEAVRRLASAIEARVRGVEQVLSAGFKVGTSASAADLSGLALKVGELKFYRRFLDEVSAIEDELAA